MYKSLKLIVTIVLTFVLAFATTYLLEFPFFRSPIRLVLVVLMVGIELFFGFVLVKDQLGMVKK